MALSPGETANLHKPALALVVWLFQRCRFSAVSKVALSPGEALQGAPGGAFTG
jgi:hypothetical protein